MILLSLLKTVHTGKVYHTYTSKYLHMCVYINTIIEGYPYHITYLIFFKKMSTYILNGTNQPLNYHLQVLCLLNTHSTVHLVVKFCYSTLSLKQ